MYGEFLVNQDRVKKVWIKSEGCASVAELYNFI